MNGLVTFEALPIGAYFVHAQKDGTPVCQGRYVYKKVGQPSDLVTFTFPGTPTNPGRTVKTGPAEPVDRPGEFVGIHEDSLVLQVDQPV